MFGAYKNLSACAQSRRERKGRGKRTSRRRSLRVRKQHDTSLAVGDELRERRGGALVRRDFAAEAGQRDGLADLWRRARAGNCALGLGRAVGLARDGADFVFYGVFDLLERRFGRLLVFLRGAHGRGGRRLALAQLAGGHGWSRRVGCLVLCCARNGNGARRGGE